MTLDRTHPSIEDPERWNELRHEILARDGAYCHYRSPILGWQCGLRRGQTYARLWWTRPHKVHLLWTRVRLDVDHANTVWEHPDEKWNKDNLQVWCHEHNIEAGWHSHTNFNHYCRLCRLLAAVLRFALLFLVRILRNLFVSAHSHARRRGWYLIVVLL